MRPFGSINACNEQCNANLNSVALYQNSTVFSTLRTEKNIGSENPEATTVSGFCYAIFQGGIQKISFSKNDLWGGLELNSIFAIMLLLLITV